MVLMSMSSIVILPPDISTRRNKTTPSDDFPDTKNSGGIQRLKQMTQFSSEMCDLPYLHHNHHH